MPDPTWQAAHKPRNNKVHAEHEWHITRAAAHMDIGCTTDEVGSSPRRVLQRHSLLEPAHDARAWRSTLTHMMCTVTTCGAAGRAPIRMQPPHLYI